MNIPDKHIAEVIEVGRRLHEQGLLAGTSGNISIRLDSKRILITGAGVAKGTLSEKELVVVDYSGNRLDGELQPSSEMLMHLFAFQKRPEIAACVHAHPPYATAFAVAGQQLESDVLPEVVLFVGEVPLTQYAPPGTNAVPESLAPFIASSNAFLLRNHGLLTLGRTLTEAYHRLETVEHSAHVLHLATALGGATHIPAGDYERLKEQRRNAKG
jgi:L-fuculose-phosphate aldolase